MEEAERLRKHDDQQFLLVLALFFRAVFAEQDRLGDLDIVGAKLFPEEVVGLLAAWSKG